MFDRLFEFGGVWEWRSFFIYFLLGVMVAGLVKLQKIHDKSRIVSFITKSIAILCLTVFSTFRGHQVGYDLGYYIEHFRNTTQVRFDLLSILSLKSTEPLYELYVYMLRQLTDNALVFLGLNALILSWAYVLLIFKLWEDRSSIVLVPLFIIGFVYKFSAVRTGMSEAFVLLSFYQMLMNRKKSAYALSVVSVLFHYTGIVGVLFNLYHHLMESLYKRHGAKKVRMAAILLVVLSVFVAQAAKAVLSKTKYAYYLRHSGTFLGNAFIVIAFVMVFLLYYHLADFKADRIALHGVLFSGIIVPIAIFLGAYRLTDFFYLLRVAAWSVATEYVSPQVLSRVSSKSSNNRWRMGAIVTIELAILVFYLLFRLSRVANSAVLMPFYFN